MQAYLDRLTDTQATEFVNKFGDVFKTLPKLPTGFIDFIVKIAPYLALLTAVITIIGGPILGILGSLSATLTADPLYFIWTILTVILMIAQAILMLLAFKPLQDRQAKGWMFLFWAEILGSIQTALNLLNNRTGSVVFGLFFALIWFYILFQMRPRYGVANQVERAVEKM